MKKRDFSLLPFKAALPVLIAFMLIIITLATYSPTNFFGIDVAQYELEASLIYVGFFLIFGAGMGYILHKQSKKRYNVSLTTHVYRMLFKRKESKLSKARSIKKKSKETEFYQLRVDMAFVAVITMLVSTAYFGLNGFLDKSDPHIHTGTIKYKYISVSKSRTAYFVIYVYEIPGESALSAHGLKKVNKEAYDLAREEKTKVSVILRDGFFGMQWVEKVDIVLSLNTWNKSVSLKND